MAETAPQAPREGDVASILRDRTFQTLVAERTRFGNVLSLVMLAIYLGFVLMVAFAPMVMAIRIGAGVTSLGIVLGLVVILIAFGLTGIYVRRANSRFDELTHDLEKRMGR